MKSKFKIAILLVPTLVLFFYNCKKDESLIPFELLIGKTWTEKTGFYNDVYLGNHKTFYKLTFSESGYCNIIMQNLDGSDTIKPPFWRPPSYRLDTFNIKYQLDNNVIQFMDNFGTMVLQWQGNIDTLKVFFHNYKIITFEESIIYLKYIQRTDSLTMSIGPTEMYLEPFENMD